MRADPSAVANATHLSDAIVYVKTPYGCLLQIVFVRAFDLAVTIRARACVTAGRMVYEGARQRVLIRDALPLFLLGRLH